ncbi:hypothetical protein JVU11DRAFT_4381 [Chiua virens]|nr:hypothetical protein JVU11DRAFT_4381 [Chiua virens]
MCTRRKTSLPSSPAKRRRGRPPRSQPPHSVPTESGPAPPSRPTSPRKRRKLDSSSDDLRTTVDPSHTEQRDDQADQAVGHHPLAVNGDHGMNGVHLTTPRDSLNTSPAIVTAEGERGTEGPLDDFIPQECTDVKSEDLGTPLTGLTSRHSVPSDDTVFVAEGVNGSAVRSKISGEGEGISPLPGVQSAGGWFQGEHCWVAGGHRGGLGLGC